MIYLLRFINVLLPFVWFVLIVLEIPISLIEYLITGRGFVLSEKIIDLSILLDNKIDMYIELRNYKEDKV